MEKDAIISFAKSFLSEPYSEEYLNKIADKNHKKFLNNLSSLDEKQITRILSEHPDYANKMHGGWHSLNYAALLNNHHILEKFMQHAINNGLSSLPRTEKVKKGVPASLNLLTFCAAMNCEKSYAKLLTYLNNPEEQDFEHAMDYAMLFNSPRTLKFLHKLVGPEQSQKAMLEFFDKNQKTSYGYRSNVQYVLKNHFKYNPERFEDYGVDINFKQEDLSNYFTMTLRVMADDFYELDDNNDNFDKVKKAISYFLEKGFNFDEKDGRGATPREYINSLINNTSSSYYSDQIEKYVKELEQKSLDNQLVKKTNPEPKKIKI
jgi:hypothetical protein